MSESTIQLSVTFEALTCTECGNVFCLSATFVRARRNDHGTFYCPIGHPQHYPSKSEAEKLRDELARERQKLDQANAKARDQCEQLAAAERRVSAAHGQLTKIKRRVGNGVCPCCNRTFSQLERHMKCKHPDYIAPALIAAKETP